MHNPVSILEKETYKFLWDFTIQTDHLISARGPDLTIINNTNRTCRIVDFAVHRVKVKENEKKDKYLDLAWGWKTLRNMKVTVIPLVIGVPVKVPKGLVQIWRT